MEKINNLLKPMLGLLLIVSFVIIFSSCEKKSPESTNENPPTTSMDSMPASKKDTSDFKTKMKEESDEMDVKYDSLKAKAKVKGNKVEKEINLITDDLKKEKDELLSSKTADKIEEQWALFKEKSKTIIDKIEKRLE